MTALSIAETLAVLTRQLRPLPVHEVALESALGAALAEEVRSSVTLPPWANAGMDGYAVRRRDVTGASEAAPVSLPVQDTVYAGRRGDAALRDGHAVRIMTGAPIPDGADAVVRVEDTDAGIDVVRIASDRDALMPLGNVRARGEDVQEGATVAHRGDVITPSLLGVLASIGVRVVPVHRAPHVVVCPTGSELLTLDTADVHDRVARGDGIVASSSYALAALLRATAADVTVMPPTEDDPELLADTLGHALELHADLIVTTGGVSAGSADHVRDVVRSLGGIIDVPRVRMRPGGPMAFGRITGTPWFGLPGNPVSTLVTAELFVRPALRLLAGHSKPYARVVPVRLAASFSAPAPLTFLLRAQLAAAEDGVLEAKPSGAQGSNLLTTMSRADALLLVEGPQPAIATGSLQRALLLDDGLRTHGAPFASTAMDG